MAVPIQTGVREASNLIAFLIQQYGKEAVLQGALANLGELAPIDCKALAKSLGVSEELCLKHCQGLPEAARSLCEERIRMAIKDGAFDSPEGDPWEGCVLRDGKVICPGSPMPPRPSPGPDPSPIEMGQSFLFYKGDFFVRTAAVRPLLASPGAMTWPASALGGIPAAQPGVTQQTSIPKPSCGCPAEGLASAVFSRGVQEGGCK